MHYLEDPLKASKSSKAFGHNKPILIYKHEDIASLRRSVLWTGRLAILDIKAECLGVYVEISLSEIKRLEK